MVSIIIPIYNAEQYLSRCLNSLIQQTSLNYEVILIDDGSTDKSADICKDFCKKNGRFIYKHIRNSGVSAARNLGIISAKGKWLSFVDADDYVEKHYVEYILKHDAKCELIIFNYHKSGVYNRESPKNIIITEPEKKALIYDVMGVPQDTPITNNDISGPFAKAFSKKLLMEYKIIFDIRLSYAEDVLFNIQAILHANRIIYDSHYVYYYMDNPESAMHKHKKTELNHENYFLSEIRKIEDTGYLEKAYDFSVLNSILILLRRDFCNKNNGMKLKERLKSFKLLLTNVSPYCDSDLRRIFRQNRDLFPVKKQILLYSIVHNKYAFIFLIYPFINMIRGND